MTHEQAFLQAIREHPHDDAPRLIYADWLEEQGGAARTARASFIRAQCRLAEMPDDDPAHDALEDEAADLLAEYEDEWTKPLHGFAEEWRFQRGFVEHIRIRSEDLLTHAERLFKLTPLRSLHFRLRLKDVPDLAACPQLRWVETLDFSRSTFNDRSLQQLLLSPYLERLTALDLPGSVINTPGMKALVQSPVFAHLRRLDLSRNMGIGDTAVGLLMQASACHLEVLNLAETNITANSVRELFGSPSLSCLQHLTISGARFGSVWQSFAPGQGEAYLVPAHLRSLDVSGSRQALSSLRFDAPTELRALHLRNLSAESADVERLAQSPGLANLKHLDLRRNNVGAAGARMLADSPLLASLTHLDLSFNNLRDAGAKALAASPHLTRLRMLDLEGNGIGGPGLKALVESANLAGLRTLNLASNFIGADSVRLLTQSAHLRNLSRLNLSDAFLEAESGPLLASSSNLARLTTLLLKKNLLGDGGVKALAQSPHLTRLAALDLNDNRIGKAGAEALAAASSWRRIRSLDLRGNVFTQTQEALLRDRFGNAVLL
jgi:uncharacterized protein (TIGR02996 family)